MTTDAPKPGDRVSVDVTWPNGHTSRLSGILVLIRDGEAYVDTERGPVVGPEESLEKDPR